MIYLYHGSNVGIDVPDLAHSKPFKDFGSGFYLSADEQQAWDMAYQKPDSDGHCHSQQVPF